MKKTLLGVLLCVVVVLPSAAHGGGDAERAGTGIPPPTPHDFAPAWFPDGERVAFSGWRFDGGGFASVAADGSDERVLVRGVAFGRISPNAEWLVYLRRNEAPGLAVSRVDGTDERQLDRHGLPTWSPDSRRIALTNLDDGLWVVDRDGSGLVQLASHAFRLPSWSPDGDEIAFLSSRSGAPVDSAELMVVDSSGGAPRTVVGASASPGQPVWSPDGALIAFADSASRAVHVVRPDGSGLRRFPDAVSHPYDGFFAHGFAWTPDSRQLVFASARGLALIKISSGRTALLGVSGHSPGVSPDGSRIGFVRPTCLGREGIHLVGLDGRGLRRLTNDCRTVGTPGPDELRGTLWTDIMLGLGGDDRLYGVTWSAEPDRMYGGPGDDLLVGSPRAPDRLEGGPGHDELRGNSGEDSLVGGPGRDYLFGGRGRDRLYARDGERDVVICGRTSAPRERDRVWADRLDFVSRDCELIRRSRR